MDSLRGPLDRLDQLVPDFLWRIVERETPIPSIAAQAQAKAALCPELVRADIGQISGLDASLEVLYGPPVGIEPLREKIAALWNVTFRLAESPGWPEPLGPSHVAITSGAAEALALLFKCFAYQKKVGVPRGHWENYANGVQAAQGEIFNIDFFDERGSLNTEYLKDQIEREDLAALVTNFPANPTGAVLTEEEASELTRVARELDLVLICDEVYSRLRFDESRPVSLIKYAPERVVCVSSASKEYLLPGARVGFAICAREALTNQVLRKLIRTHTGSPNVIGQQRLLALLSDDLEDIEAGLEPRHFTRIRNELRMRKDRLVDVLKRHEFPLVGRPEHPPLGTIFLMTGLPSWWRGDENEFVSAALEAGCVSTIPGSAFGIADSLRFSFGGMTAQAIEQLDKNLTEFRASLA